MNLEIFCHTPESFSRLEQKHQDLISELASIVGSNPMPSPYESRQFISRIFQRKGLYVPDELYQNMEPDDSLEVWTHDAMFLFAMGPLLKRTSYTIHQLATIPWDQLFERAELIEKRILLRLRDALTTSKTQYEVADWHLVKERESAMKNSFTVKIKQVTPFTSEVGVRGVFALVKVKQFS